MKLYVSADMEGTAGVCAWQQCDPADVHEYPMYRRYMTREVRAAIEGAWQGGVTDVLVNDSHWAMRNLLLDELPDDERLRVISGTRKPWSMGEGLAADFAAAFFTGYHAKAGDSATLSHTFSPETLYNVVVNGTHCSEALLIAALAGTYGVPVVLITGDRTIVDETIRAMPWCTGVAVKNAIGFSAIDSLTPEAAQTEIRVAASEAIARIGRAKPFVFDAPFELVIETVNVENADFIELMPDFVRVGARAVRFRCDAYPQLLRAFVAATRLGAAANA
ncbi:MAG: M55 family metallopeptidase [Candidatus Eremiobacteraeota bacterium]|nr:M55 family metallopeptidase [Candidatus Eremiobacteraeota bacterium]